MAYDPYNRLFRPDVQSEPPGWLQMDDDNAEIGQDAGSVMGLLRKRIGAPPETGKGAQMAGGAGKAMSGAGKAMGGGGKAAGGSL